MKNSANRYKQKFSENGLVSTELCITGLSPGFPGGSDSKVSACNEGDLGLIPGSERSPGKGNGNPLQYSCLGNLIDRGAWQATVHGGHKELDMTERPHSVLSDSLFHCTNTYGSFSFLFLHGRSFVGGSG